MSPYSKPLDPERKEIRRLILQPISAGAQAQCSVETVSLLDQPEYEALSYVWGNAATKQNIMFDKKPFPVTKNLAIALHYLRLPDKPRKLWVDSLCINQSDVKERNEQVRMMGEIYAIAKPVLIWLGEGIEGVDDSFAMMNTIVNEAEYTEELGQKMFSFYMQLVQREWFTRLWTVQELVLAAQDPLVGCGLAWSKWSIFLGAWQRVAMIEFAKMGMIIPKEGEYSDDNESTFSSGARTSGTKIDLLGNLCTSVSNKGGIDLRSLLLNTHSAQATEPRDRIYALLGMMRKENREDFTVDYTRPVGTVFAEAVAHIFKNANGPFILSGMELAGCSFGHSFPSWVPRLGSNSLLHPTRFHPPGIGASGAGSDCMNGSVDENLNTLSVRGLHIDVISEKIVFGENDECLSQLAHVEALVGKAHQLAVLNSNNRPYLRGLKTKEPVWRTLITNKAYSGAKRQVAPDSYGEMHKTLLRQQDNTEDSEKTEDELAPEYRLSLLNHLPSNCFFITAAGFYGIGQKTIEDGDHLAIWFGAPAPFVLRPAIQSHVEEHEKVYNVLGVAYVAGIMDGEMVDEVYCEELEDDVVFTVV